MFDSIVIAFSLNLVVLFLQPLNRHIIELVITVVYELELVADSSSLEAAEIHVVVRPIGIRNITELLEAVDVEHTFGVFPPVAPWTDRSLGIHIMRSCNVALQCCDFFDNNRQIVFDRLIHIEEDNEFLTFDIVIDALAVSILGAVINILAIEYGKIVIHLTVIAGIA